MFNLYNLEGEKELKEKIKINPDDLHSMLRLADLYSRRNKKKKAIEYFEKVAKEYVVKGKSEYANAIINVMYLLYPDQDFKQDITKSFIEKKTYVKKEKNLKEFLKRIELFRDFSDEHIEFIKLNSKLVEFEKSETIIREGEKGDSIYVVLEGSVKIYLTTEFGKIVELAILTQGDFFGEMGFFGNGYRRASVDAIDDVKLLEIPKKTLLKVIEMDPNLKEVLNRYYQERILDLILASSSLFHSVDPKTRSMILKKFKLVKFKKGEIIIKEGDISDAMYIIKSGYVEVFIEKEGMKKVLAELSEGEFFGEIAVLTGQKRTASVLAKTDVELMKLTKKDIDEVIQYNPKLLDILRNFVQKRSSDTFQKLMELKKISAKRGII